jgi:trehalose-6-phosphate synthase
MCLCAIGRPFQVAPQTTESDGLVGGVSDAAARINAVFSTLTYQPISFLHTQQVPFSHHLALLSVADEFVITGLQEGMTFRTHELCGGSRGEA